MIKPLVTPTSVARHLKDNPSEAPQVATDAFHTVCLGTQGGWMVLSWSADVINKWDWVGLYESDDAPDSQYLTWYWAENGSRYESRVGTETGYQARYLVWDRDQGKYVSVARTPTYPGPVCSG